MTAAGDGDCRPSDSSNPRPDPDRTPFLGEPAAEAGRAGRVSDLLHSEPARRITRAFALGVALGLFLLRRARRR